MLIVLRNIKDSFRMDCQTNITSHNIPVGPIPGQSFSQAILRHFKGKSDLVIYVITSFIYLYHKEIAFILQFKKEYNNGQIIQGIKSDDNDILRYIYRTYYPEVVEYAKRKIGNKEDAKDIFQEAIIIIETKVKEKDFALHSTFRAYMFSISKILCLRYLEKKGIRNRAFNTTSTIEFIVDKTVDVNQDIADKLEENERYKLYLHHFNNLSENYRDIIRLKLEKVPLKEIARMLGYKDEKQVRNLIYYCKNKLISDIKNDPAYHELCMETTGESVF